MVSLTWEVQADDFRFKESRGFLFEDSSFRNALSYSDNKSVFKLIHKTDNQVALGSKLFYVKPEAIEKIDIGLTSWSLQLLDWKEGLINFYFFPLLKETRSKPHSWKPLTLFDYSENKKELSLIIKPVQSSIDMSVKAATLSEKKEIIWDVNPQTPDELKVVVPLKHLLGISTKWSSEGVWSLKYKTKFNKVPVIVIDPGHGNGDGACFEGFCEENIVMKFSQMFQSHLEKIFKGTVRIMMTRKDELKSVSLQERVVIAENEEADILMSFHMDSSSPAEKGITPVRGMNCFYKNAFSLELAEELCSKFQSGYPQTYIVKRNLHILHSYQFPSVLVELGNLKFEEDRKFFSSEKKMKILSWELAEKVKKYVSHYH